MNSAPHGSPDVRVSAGDVTPALAAALAGRPVDFSGLPQGQTARLAALQGCGALLQARLHEGTAIGLPESEQSILVELAQQQAAIDLAARHRTRKALTLLAAAGIDVLLLKGTPLAHLHYAAPYHRWRSDNDLYIGHQDRARTKTLLTERGYTLERSDMREHTSKQMVATRPSAGHAVNFDIHWKLSNRVLFADTLPFDECWESRQPVPTLGEHAWALSDIDLLLHACIHRIAHGRGSERNRLIWLYDIHLLWTALGEQAKEAFIEKALDKKIGAVCADALQVCEKIFSPVGARHAGEDEPIARMAGSYSDLLKNVEKEPTARLIEAGKLRWAWADLMATPGLKNKLQFAGELIRNKM